MAFSVSLGIITLIFEINSIHESQIQEMSIEVISLRITISQFDGFNDKFARKSAVFSSGWGIELHFRL